MSSDKLLRNRFGLALVSSAVLALAAIALLWPIALDHWDQYGFRIACGNGASTEYTQAAAADQENRNAVQGQATERATDYVGDCRSATWWRRGWTAPLAILGIVGLVIPLRDHRRRRHDR